MTELTPRYEGINGSDCTGLDGETGRTYLLSNLNFYSVIEFLKNSVGLHETEDFNIVGRTITFNVIVWDADVISLRYFTDGGAAIVAAGYGYVSTANVYMTSGITSAEISTTDVSMQIQRAETIICRMTRNIYWNIAFNNRSVTSATNDTLTETGVGWTANALVDMYVWIYSGKGSVQLRKITANTTDTLTVDSAWSVNPDSTSKYKVFYVPADFNPRISDVYDGTGMNYMYLPYYPVKNIESLTIGYTPVTVTPTNVYVWEKTGKIQLKPTAEAQIFSQIYPQEVAIDYWYGVDHLPQDIKRLVELHCSIQILAQQMGGTFDDPSSVSLPEATVTVGQAYINIRSSLETLKEEYTELLKTVKIWPVFS